MDKLQLSELTAISPLDGRYRSRLAELADYFSELALIRTRFEIEAKYLIVLSDIGLVRKLTAKERRILTSFGQEIDLARAARVKQIEQETRHDVKALEKAFREIVARTSLADLAEMIHFGLTSEDVNNLAYRLMLVRATHNVCLPKLEELTSQLVIRAQKYKATPMLARTHGQAAVPTTLGKELVVFADRLNRQVKRLDQQKLFGKLTGAVGNFNAHTLAAPDINWIAVSQNFVKSFGFEPNLVTTQINPYDDLIEYLQIYARINSIIINFDQDMWRYISDDWFIQEVKRGEVGSSTMPQKVNPIDFENSEGNLTMAAGLIETLARKLAVTRLQRDLSDSTLIRNLGTVLGHSLLGWQSALEGLARVRPNLVKIAKDLQSDWSVLAEGVQTLLKRHGVKDPYSLVTSVARGEHFDQNSWQTFVRELPQDNKVKAKLTNFSPANYIGLAIELTELAIGQIKASRKK